MAAHTLPDEGDMSIEEALAELRAAGYEHAASWTLGAPAIYLNDGPLDERGRRTGGSISIKRWTFRVDAKWVWMAVFRAIAGIPVPPRPYGFADGTGPHAYLVPVQSTNECLARV